MKKGFSLSVLSVVAMMVMLPVLTSARPYIVGVDISWVTEDEHTGATYWDNGVQKDIFQILKEHGVNFIRIRTFVDPCHSEGYAYNSYSAASGQECWCDLEHTIEIAKRIKKAGMGFLLDFHMSDTWASIGHQYVPRAWANDNDEQMRKHAYDYTKHNIQTLVNLGLRPDMVQVGNEINTKMSGVSISNASRFAALINAGVKGVRDVDPTIKIVMQHGRPRPDGGFMDWYNTIKGRVDYDFIGGSTYGTTNNGGDWRDMFGNVVKDGTPVMSLEYTANRTALINTVMSDFPNNMGLGTFVWEPTRYDTPMFDRSGNRYTSNAKLDELFAISKKLNATLPDFVKLDNGPSYTIKTSAGPGGIIQQDPVGEKLPEGAKISFTAVPHEGWEFVKWSGDHTGTASTYSVASLKSNITLNAEFRFTSTDSSLYEGENAMLINSVVETTNSGFSGAGYANFNNEIGSAVEFPVCVSQDGQMNVHITFANGSSINRPVSVSVNGSPVVSSLNFDPTGAWTTWNTQEIKINLNQGINTIRFTSLTSDGGPNLDKIELSKAVTTAARNASKNSEQMFKLSGYTVKANCPGRYVAVQLYSINGKRVLSRMLNGHQEMKLPVHQLESGRYIIKIKSGKNLKVQTVNIVK